MNPGMNPEPLTFEIETICYRSGDHVTAEAVAVRNGEPSKQKDLYRVSGLPAEAQVGDWWDVQGQWRGSRSAKDFLAQASTLRRSARIRAIEQYLVAQVKSIGPVNARRIVEAFGEATMDVIDREPAKLVGIKGIGKDRIAKITKEWDASGPYREFLLFAIPVGLGGSVLKKVWGEWGVHAEDKIRSNPYRLSRLLHGWAFHKCDELARKLGWPALSFERFAAAATHVLEEAEGEGHCFLYETQLTHNAVECLGGLTTAGELGETPDGGVTEISPAAVMGVVRACAERGDFVVEDSRIYRTEMNNMERFVATKLREWAGEAVLADPAHLDRAIGGLGFELNPDQRKALHDAWHHRISVMSGLPGSGKTSCLKAFVDAARDAGESITLLAPTGMAAERMRDTTGFEASTIHRWVYRQGDFLYNGIVVVDESSMLAVDTLAWLFGSLGPETRLFFIGDADQLPSIGAGNVLRDLIESGVIPYTKFDKIYRQAEGSEISFAAAAINRGHMPRLNLLQRGREIPHTDFYTAIKEEAEQQVETAKLACSWLAPQYGFDPIDDVQVMAPMNRGVAGIANLNEQLRRHLNPHEKQYQCGFEQWARGDKVMITKNNYDLGVLNGDVGRILEISANGPRVRGAVIRIGRGQDTRDVEFGGPALFSVRLAYACSVHKYQGGQIPMAVILLHNEHYVMLQRNLLYTALTRAKKLALLIAHPFAASRAVENNPIIARNTYLKERLTAA